MLATRSAKNTVEHGQPPATVLAEAESHGLPRDGLGVLVGRSPRHALSPEQLGRIAADLASPAGLTEKASVVDLRDATSGFANAMPDGAAVEDLERWSTRLLHDPARFVPVAADTHAGALIRPADGTVVRTGGVGGGFTTAELLAHEARQLEAHRGGWGPDGSGIGVGLAAPGALHGALAGAPTLRGEQRDMVERLCTSGVGFEVVHGGPGTGKTFALGVAAQAWQDSGMRVLGCSFDDLAGRFDWLKDELADEPYAGQIVWRENDQGVWDVTYLLALLACFNIFDYPNEGTKHPVWAYRKVGVLRSFEANPETLQRLRPIAKDVFKLHDIVSAEAKDLYNARTGGKYGAWSFVQKKPSPYVVSGHPDGNQMLGGALFPILGAFRWAVVEGPDSNARWEGTFDDVLDLMRGVLPELVTLTGQASQEIGRNIHALGRSPNHWNSLHDKVGLRYLQQKAAAASV